MGQKKGFKHSEETKKKISKTLEGKKHSLETRKKMSLIHMGNKYRLGKKHTEKTIRKMSDARKGEKNPAWKGGVSPINKIIRKSKEYKEWRKRVFKRDNYTCQKCGVRSGKGIKVYLHPHHIMAFAKYPSYRFEEVFGQTLCKGCHFEQHKILRQLKKVS